VFGWFGQFAGFINGDWFGESNAAVAAQRLPGAGSRKKNRSKNRPIKFRGKFYHPERDAYALARDLEAWVDEKPQVDRQIIKPVEALVIETDDGDILLPPAPVLNDSEIKRLESTLAVLRAKDAETKAYIAHLRMIRRMMADEDDVEMLLMVA
jgi:hypothetical protein